MIKNMPFANFLNKNKKRALPKENYNQVLSCILSLSLSSEFLGIFDLYTFRLYFSPPHSLSHSKQSGSAQGKLYMQRSLAISRWPNPGAFLQ